MAIPAPLPTTLNPDPTDSLAQLLGVSPDALAAMQAGGKTIYSPDIAGQDASREALDAEKKSLGTESVYGAGGSYDKSPGVVSGRLQPTAFASGASPSDVASRTAEQDTQDASNKLIADFLSPAGKQMRDAAQTTALAPDVLKGKQALDLEAAKTTGALALQKQKDEATAAEATRSAAPPSGTAGAETAPQWRQTINPKGQSTWTQVATPAQIISRQTMATRGLEQIAPTQQMIDTLEHQGVLGPVASRFTNVAASTPGLNGLSEMLHPGGVNAMKQFQGQLLNLKAAISGAVNSRGGNPALIGLFDKTLNENQEPDAIRGGVAAAERWLTTYANAKNSDELDAADAALGVTGGPYARPTGSAAPDDPAGLR